MYNESLKNFPLHLLRRSYRSFSLPHLVKPLSKCFNPSFPVALSFTQRPCCILGLTLSALFNFLCRESRIWGQPGLHGQNISRKSRAVGVAPQQCSCLVCTKPWVQPLAPRQDGLLFAIYFGLHFFKGWGNRVTVSQCQFLPLWEKSPRVNCRVSLLGLAASLLGHWPRKETMSWRVLALSCDNGELSSLNGLLGHNQLKEAHRCTLSELLPGRGGTPGPEGWGSTGL